MPVDSRCRRRKRRSTTQHFRRAFQYITEIYDRAVDAINRMRRDQPQQPQPTPPPQPIQPPTPPPTPMPTPLPTPQSVPARLERDAIKCLRNVTRRMSPTIRERHLWLRRASKK